MKKESVASVNKMKKIKDIEILYEDEDLMVLNKPSGLVVHPDGRTVESSLSSLLVEKFPYLKGVGEVAKYEDGREIEKWGIVHRLDRETSGAMVVAKRQESFLFLKRQFQERTVRKVYNAFLWGEMKKDEGRIDREIGRSRRDARLWSASRGAKGEMREAVTYFRVLWRGEGFSFVEAEPKTGRTHQIRVHFKAINYPVVGDKLYSREKDPALGFERTALHARLIEIKNTKGQKVEVVAPYPKDFKKAMSDLKIKV